MDISHSQLEVKKAPSEQAQPGQFLPDSLLYLNSNNAAENNLHDQKEWLYKTYDHGIEDNKLLDSLLTPYNKKQAFALVENTKHFIEEVGIDNVGFLTLTFKENIKDHKEAYRRFNTLRKHFLSPVFGDWMRVSERQKRGAWHFHLLVDCKKNIRSGINFDEIYGKNGRPKYKSASPYLRSLWASLRYSCQKYGFGRSELLPIQSNTDGMSKYIGKYLSKHNAVREDRDKGVRLVGYSGKKTRTTTNFQWNSDGSKEWRRKVAKFALILGLEDISEFAHHFGPKWCHTLQPFILSVDALPIQGIVKIAQRMSKFGDSFRNALSEQNKDLIDMKTGEVLF